jgi:NAD(P)-dependent dehydrogenase (short-subunit alcohol dehydrogenase family)
VLITGCSSGFGRLMVGEFLDQGWRVLAGLRRAPERSELFAAERARAGDRLRLLDLDVNDAGGRRAAVAAVAEWADGRLDCLVNNAGQGIFGALEDASEAEIRAQLEVNFTGLALLTRDLLPALRAARGRLICVSSVLGYAGLPLSSLYCASKHAVEGLGEALAYELEPHGVQVCLVEPGSFRTEFSGNAAWVARTARERTPYSAMTRAYRAQRARLAASLGADPRGVTRAVTRLAGRARLPLRYRCGRDARAAFWLKRLLPARLFHAIVARVYRVALRAPLDAGAPALKH